jgi:NADH-quinone oxidoreductase subunit J
MMLLLAPVTGQLVNPATLTAWPIERIVFWFIAAITVGGAILTITRKNPIGAVMSLVASFFGLAASYAMLYAHFLAELQVLVYAGAIMTLFVFVVMVLNREETDSVSWRGVFLKAIGFGCLTYSTLKLGWYLGEVKPLHPEAPPATFGTVAEVGTILFTDYLFAFEAVSVLLLIAVIAAVVVARTHKHVEPTEPAAPAETPDGGHH